MDDAIERGWPIEDSDEYETVAGWMIDELDKLPQVGDELERDGWTFKVTATDGRRIESVRVTAPEPAPEQDPEGSGSPDGETGGAPERGERD